MLKISRFINITLASLSLLIIYALITTKSSISQKKKQIGTLNQHLEKVHDWQDALEAELNLVQSRPHLTALAKARFGDALISAAQEIHVRDLPLRDPEESGNRRALAMFAEAIANQDPTAPPYAPSEPAARSGLSNSPLIGHLIQQFQAQEQGSQN